MPPAANTTDRHEVTLAIGGMSCASCAARVEKRLNQVDGVVATVNFATEQATVDFPAGVTAEDLVAAVEETGYTATLPAGEDQSAAPEESDATTSWRRRLLISAVAHRSGGAAVDGARAAVRLLAVACPRPCHPCRGVGRVAVPPRRVGQPAPPRRDDGHPRLGRRGRRLPLVASGRCSSPMRAHPA